MMLEGCGCKLVKEFSWRACRPSVQHGEMLDLRSIGGRREPGNIVALLSA